MGCCKKCHINRTRSQVKRWRTENPEKIVSLGKEWREKNPGYMKAWNARKRNSIARDCLNHPDTSNWRFSDKQNSWICQDCEADARQVKHFKKVWLVNARRYGPDFADLYQTRMSEKDPSLTHRQFSIRILGNELIQRTGRNLTSGQITRIFTMNRVQGNPAMHIGWKCSVCLVEDKDFAFFDIHHKHPRADGGCDTESNLQVLCPNCHRRETLTWMKSRNFKNNSGRVLHQSPGVPPDFAPHSVASDSKPGKEFI